MAEAAPTLAVQGGEDPLATQLAATLLPELAAYDQEPVALTLRPGVDEAFALRRVGIRLVPSEPVRALSLRVGHGSWAVVTPHGAHAVQPGAQLPGFTVQAIPRLLGTGPHLLPAPSSWITAYVPGETYTASRLEFAAFQEAMTSGAAVLQQHWPEAWVEVCRTVRLLLPLPG